MAKIYCCPEEVREPDFGDHFVGNVFDGDAYFEAVKDHRTELAEWCKNYNPEDNSTLIGETVSWPVADGRAEYMVLGTKGGLSLIHLNYSDGYHIDPVFERALRVSDIREAVKREKAINQLFSAA